jgi:nucleoid DNA-binding protein
MATLLNAFRAYGPKLDLGPTAQLDELVDWMASRTGINKSEVMMMFQEMSEMILTFNLRGISVKLPGVGTFAPSVDRHGTIKNNFRSDAALKKGSNAPDAYKGEIVNRERIGLDDAGYKALWDPDHPGDPLEV